MNVPSENVKSMRALRVNDTRQPFERCDRMIAGGHTATETFKALTFLQEAVNLPHLAHRCFRPSFGGYNRFDLFAQGLQVLWLRREVQERVRDALPYEEYYRQGGK